jgi:hypothetical protein
MRVLVVKELVHLRGCSPAFMLAYQHVFFGALDCHRLTTL